MFFRNTIGKTADYCLPATLRQPCKTQPFGPSRQDLELSVNHALVISF